MGLNVYSSSITSYKSFAYHCDKTGKVRIISALYHEGLHIASPMFRPVLDNLNNLRVFYTNSSKILCPELPSTAFFRDMIAQGFSYQGESYNSGDF